MAPSGSPHLALLFLSEQVKVRDPVPGDHSGDFIRMVQRIQQAVAGSAAVTQQKERQGAELVMLAEIGEQDFQIFNFAAIGVAGEFLKLGEILQVLADSGMGEIK
ncbi:hypothetical protein D3C73_1348430 [compost metagenome]